MCDAMMAFEPQNKHIAVFFKNHLNHLLHFYLL